MKKCTTTKSNTTTLIVINAYYLLAYGTRHLLYILNQIESLYINKQRNNFFIAIIYVALLFLK